MQDGVDVERAWSHEERSTELWKKEKSECASVSTAERSLTIRRNAMNLIREILSDRTVTAMASVILIVAALPMVGWSWAVSHMVGPKVKNGKEGT